jgi:hypothetical protein
VASSLSVIRTDSTSERVALGVVLIGWLVVLVSVLTHALYVSHDSISNNAHIWYVSRQIWDGHRIPLHMPMLAQGDALAFPYAFVPWTTAALLRPLLGEWVVTLWLVGGFIALVVMMFWALPELRRGWLAAAVLVNPALVMALLVGQIPFIWAAAMLFAAIGAWRREHAWVATAFAGLAMATHAAVLAPITMLVVIAYLPFTRSRRAVIGHYLIAVIVAVPAALMIMLSPAIEQSSTTFRIEQVIRVAATRGTVFLVPIALAALADSKRRWIGPAALGVLASINAVALGPMNRYAWASPWRQPDESVSALIDSPQFVPGATYRVLGFSDGRVSMYRLIQNGAQLDGEFFPESMARQSWDSVAEYEQALADRHVDFVMAWNSYDARWRTNEHALLRQMATGPQCVDTALSVTVVMSRPDYDVFAIEPCR